MGNVYYLLRHGESKFNFEKRHQGWKVGNPLTKVGLEQAEEVSRQLVNQSIDIIYSSPLLRTKQTAKLTSEHTGIPISYSSLLSDFRRSKSQEGLHVHEYNKLPEFKLWLKNSDTNLDFALPDGESKKEFSSRINKFARFCNRNYIEKKITIITHLEVIRQLVIYWTDNVINRDDISNCTIINVIPEKKCVTFFE